MQQQHSSRDQRKVAFGPSVCVCVCVQVLSVCAYVTACKCRVVKSIRSVSECVYVLSVCVCGGKGYVFTYFLT